MASSFTAKARVVPMVGPAYTVSSGPNSSKANALLELDTILGTVVGQAILTVSVTEHMPLADAGLELLNDTDQYEDASIPVQKTGDLPGTFKTRVIHVENMSTAYAVEGHTDLVDTENADVAAIITAYRDSSGNNGYTADPTAPARYSV